MRKATEEWRPLKVIGSTVKALRTARGLTQGQLAARAAMHENYVWGIENGLRNVSAINLLSLSPLRFKSIPANFGGSSRSPI
ncbi:MAG: Helix-turn-helix domain [Thermoanaerobaculia bacterium]|jgi:transcriptional regulator with XRE-family HTH domain|nr:Helix-turn-helix domain [Thermoanaerobaculia bacterium]